MAGARRQQTPTFPRGASENLFAPTDVAGRIHNFVVTPDGSLRSVVGPAEYTPKYEGVDASFGSFTVSDAYGIHHALLHGGRRSVLLCHFNGGIYEHRGWLVGTGASSNLGWYLLIAPTGQYAYAPPEADDRSGFLTQFVSTPGGVVIVPQGGRAFFYDGEIVAPLGYAEQPGPPQGTNPSLEQSAANVWTAYGRVLDGRGQPQAFGFNRFGPLLHTPVAAAASGDSNPYGAVLQKCARRARTQWVDLWGNLSPASAESDAVVFQSEQNITKDRKNDNQEPGGALRKQIPWYGIDQGPDRTVGRILALTKDLENSGDPNYYVAPADTAVSLSAFATIPDNRQKIWMDNVADVWLQVPMQEVAPVPTFRLATMAFGRLWIANWPGNEGAVRPSLPGRWGTFPVDAEIYPDPAAEVTGLLAVAQGLIVCTEQSTFIIENNDGGDGFRARTLSGRAGCVSPNSMQVLPGGRAIWLGREGWYLCDGATVEMVSQDINNEVMRRINRGRWRRATAAFDTRSGEYRCWVALNGSRTNNLCVVFDGAGWRTRDDVQAKDVCVTQDHRSLMLAAGVVPVTDDTGSFDHTSVWVLDHEARGLRYPQARTAVFETAWMRVPGEQRGSAHDAQFWLRATSNTTFGTVNVYRDWKEHPSIETHTDVSLKADEDANLFWAATALAGTYTEELRSRTAVANHWTARRPFWYRLDTHVPDCEVWKVELRVTGDVDLVGVGHSENMSGFNGASKPAKRG